MNEDIEQIALDVHAHLVPIYSELLAGIDGVDWLADTGQLVVDGHTIGIKKLFQPEQLLAWMDEHKIAQAWISIPPPLYRQQISEEQAGPWFSYLNDGLDRICVAYPGRLVPLYHLPLEHPALAIDIARKRVGAGNCGFSVAAGGHEGIVYSDAVLEPLWELLDSRSCFVFMHPGHCCDGRLSVFYLENLVGNPHETTVAVSHLIFGGVCERHPLIRFCLAHGGGTMALIAGRLQQGFDTSRPGVNTALECPREALHRFRVDCVLHDADALALAAAVFGEEHVLFGSDWPFPMGLLRPHAQLAHVGVSLRHRIFVSNADDLVE
ncbi:MAG: amidohydrolase [Candidimonas sp.]|nr:MAG: amidohydrolase [Candidimonas sp.]TAM19521.1 MAG: amidohydrolase [Candidimonas sp.]TAM80162.1 MAG: amidohydrolase [Candidimonas sp.]